MTTINMNELINDYIDLKAKEKELKAELKWLTDIIKDSIEEWQTIEWDEWVVKKISKTRYKLKEWVSASDIIKEYPDAVKYDVDMNWLKNNSEWHQYLEPNVSFELRIWKKG